MSKEQKNEKPFNKYISLVLAIVVIVAVGVYTYTHFVEKEPTQSDDDHTPVGDSDESLLSVRVGSIIVNYTLDELKSIGTVTGKGAYVNKVGQVTGPYNYTGVSIPVLINIFEGFPDNYTLQAVASDNYSVEYSYDEVNGNVTVYNETGSEIGTSSMTMIIAYMENGQELDEESGGPLRIVFINDEGSITWSGSWLRSLVRLEISED